MTKIMADVDIINASLFKVAWSTILCPVFGIIMENVTMMLLQYIISNSQHTKKTKDWSF